MGLKPANMSHTIHITQKPTFDLEEIILQHVDIENGLAYFETKQVFLFDQVFGNLENRSRVLRRGKAENDLVIQIISATIDAGYCGRLHWKTMLTKYGVRYFESHEGLDFVKAAELFKGCQQIHMFPFEYGNYYGQVFDASGNLIGGTNQTDLEPDVVFRV
jgi:hypothetical protein